MRENIAIEKRNKGYNCGQAVFCTYCKDFGIDEEVGFKISEALGSGLGNTKGSCGAMVAACMLVGLETSTANLEKPNSKGKTYAVSRNVVNDFEEMSGATICKDIKGLETGKVLCECQDCVANACEIVEKYINVK